MDITMFPPKPKARPADAGALDLFAPAAPDIRTPAPVAPGSASSEDAAGRLDPAVRRGQHMRVLLVLAKQHGAISRERLSELTQIKESTLCARLADLRPVWVEAISKCCTSSAGVSVDGYRITDAGRKRAKAI